MNDVEALRRLVAPITKVYSESSSPPITGLNGCAFLILNNDYSNSMTATFIHNDGETTVIPIPVNASFESHIKEYKGITISGSSTSYNIFVKELL